MRKLTCACAVLAALSTAPVMAGNPDRASPSAREADRVIDGSNLAFVADRHLALYRATRAALHHVAVVENGESGSGTVKDTDRVSAYVMPRTSATAALPLSLPQPVMP